MNRNQKFAIAIGATVFALVIIGTFWIKPNDSAKPAPAADSPTKSVRCTLRAILVDQVDPSDSDSLVPPCWFYAPFAKLKAVGVDSSTSRVLFRYEDCQTCRRGPGDQLSPRRRENACPSPCYFLVKPASLQEWVAHEEVDYCREKWQGWLDQARRIQQKLGN
jgi:hypothetical protein